MCSHPISTQRPGVSALLILSGALTPPPQKLTPTPLSGCQSVVATVLVCFSVYPCPNPGLPSTTGILDHQMSSELIKHIKGLAQSSSGDILSCVSALVYNNSRLAIENMGPDEVYFSTQTV